MVAEHKNGIAQRFGIQISQFWVAEKKLENHDKYYRIFNIQASS